MTTNNTNPASLMAKLSHQKSPRSKEFYRHMGKLSAKTRTKEHYVKMGKASAEAKRLKKLSTVAVA